MMILEAIGDIDVDLSYKSILGSVKLIGMSCGR